MGEAGVESSASQMSHPHSEILAAPSFQNGDQLQVHTPLHSVGKWQSKSPSKACIEAVLQQTDNFSLLLSLLFTLGFPSSKAGFFCELDLIGNDLNSAGYASYILHGTTMVHWDEAPYK